MSAPETQSATSNQTLPPDIHIFARVASIPLISSSLESINEVLTTNAFTRQPYAHAKVISTTAYKLTEPIQVRLAPIIIRVDGFANKAVDVVQARYPYPFHVHPQEVATYVRERKDSTVSGVNKAIDDRVMTPAMNVAQGIDHSFAPIIDYFEHAVSKFNHSDAGPATPTDAKYQYQRALVLSKTLGENLIVLTSDQLKHLQAQSAIAQRASETGSAITSAASSSLSSAQSRIHSLSDTMIHELQKLQASTSHLATSLQSGVQDSVHHQVSQIQQSYTAVTGALSNAVNDLTSIITEKDLPVQEKMSRFSKQVQNRVTPLLDAIKKGASEVLARSKETAETAPSVGTNGHAATNGQ